jgi:hypothetical protein
VKTSGDVRWEIGIFDRDKGARVSDAHGPKMNEIPGATKSAWELGDGRSQSQPDGFADYIEFIFNLPDDIPPSTPLNLRLVSVPNESQVSAVAVVAL